MKRYGLIVLILTGLCLAQPIVIKPKPVVDKTVKKIDDQTVEVTTTTTTKVEYDKAVLQTELDHIPDRIAELEKKIDELNERKIELEAMLKVLQ